MLSQLAQAAGRGSECEPVSLLELLVPLIEEYARHNRHAGLLREHIDRRPGPVAPARVCPGRQSPKVGHTDAQMAYRDAVARRYFSIPAAS